MPLTDQQLQAIPVLDWLLDFSNQHRRTGRSEVIALCLVRRAARHPHQDVRFGDLPFELGRDPWSSVGSRAIIG